MKRVAVASSPTTRVPVKKVEQNHSSAADDIVAVEEPLSIRLSWPDGSDVGRVAKDIAVTMRTPGQDEELALGFLFTEGIVSSPEEIDAIERPETDDDTAGNIVNVLLHGPPVIDLTRLQRNFYVSSSCGVCGKASLDAIRTRAQFDVQGEGFTVCAAVLAQLPEQLATGQATFAGTGSVHAAVMFAPTGLCSPVYEDVGRHNALDKLIGARFREACLPLSGAGIFVSGRSSFELVQKARMAGCAMLAAVGAPSSLAIELAWESDMTLVGFVRDGRFNVYAGPGRIV
jgi:FdhD protein